MGNMHTGTMKNIALEGTATQIDNLTYGSYWAPKAIDGKTLGK